MHELLSWAESSVVGQTIRHAGPWAYAVINLGHILGVSALVGAIVILDLRLLGVWPRIPLAAIADTAGPVGLAGLVLALLTGAGLLATNATEYQGNPFLLVKLPAIACGLINAAVLRRSAAWRAKARRELLPAERRRLAWGGGVSLACWLTAAAAGRLIAYW